MNASFRYPPPQGPWVIAFEWAELDDRLEVVSVTVAAADRDRPVTTSDLRAIPFASLINDARRQMVERMPGDSLDIRKARSGRTRLDKAHFENVAAAYIKAHKAGRSPTKEIAELFKVSKSTAAKWVGRARHDFDPPLLGPTPKGKAGGIGTDGRSP
ncbi:MAG TPA: hypothetical protein VMP13_08400 [Acidimicrobiia bacterium]|nr:hypothetical protein [Acidimicrobiia bacterium]